MKSSHSKDTKLLCNFSKAHSSLLSKVGRETQETRGFYKKWVALGGKHIPRGKAKCSFPLEIHPDMLRCRTQCSSRKELATAGGSPPKALGAGCTHCGWALGPRSTYRSSPGKSNSSLEAWDPDFEDWDKEYEDTFGDKSDFLRPVCSKDL